MFLPGVDGAGPVLHGDAAVAPGLPVQGEQRVHDDGTLAQVADRVVELFIHLPQKPGVSLVKVKILQVGDVGQLGKPLGSCLLYTS